MNLYCVIVNILLLLPVF